MTNLPQQLLRAITFELELLVEPFLHVGRQPVSLYRFLAEMGWDLEPILGAGSGEVFANIAHLQSAVVQVVVALQEPDDQAMVEAAHAQAAVAMAEFDTLYYNIMGLDPLAAADSWTQATAASLAGDIVEYLLLLYVARRLPWGLQLALLFGLVVKRRQAPIFAGGDPDAAILRYPLERPALNWTALGDPDANPLLALVESVDLRTVRTIGDFLATVGAIFNARLAEMTAALGRRRLDGMQINLDHAGLDLIGGGWLPFPDAGEPEIRLELPVAYTPTLLINAGRWRLEWLPSTPGNGSTQPLFSVAGFAVNLLGGLPAGPAAATLQPGFTLSEAEGALVVDIIGGVSIELSAALLPAIDGGTITGSALAWLHLKNGGRPSLTVERLAIAATDIALGGGLILRAATLEIGSWTVLATPADGQLPFTVDFAGALELPGDQHVAVSGKLDGDRFALTSTGGVHFGNGIRLQPQGNDPILSLTAEAGDEFTFDVKGNFLAPHEGGTRTVALAGSLRLKRDPATGAPDITHIAVAGEATGPLWTLPGGPAVEGFGVALSYGPNGFAAGVHGQLRLDDGLAPLDLEATLELNINDPTDIAFTAVVSADRLNLFDQAYLFDATLSLEVATQPPAGHLSLAGTAALLPAAAVMPALPSPDDFFLAVADFSGTFDIDANGFVVEANAGTLRLPAAFGPDPDGIGAAPTVTLTPGAPLSLRYDGAGVTFAGSFIFRDFGVSLGPGGAGDVVIKLEEAMLTLNSVDAPALGGVKGFLRLPLPGTTAATIGFEGFTWQLDGMPPPTGVIALREDVSFPLGEGFAFVLRGGSQSGHPVTGLTLSRDNGRLRVEAATAMALVIPVTMLTNAAGDAVQLGAAGRLTWTENEPLPALNLDQLSFAADFHLGGANGLLVEGGSITLDGIEHLVAPTPSNPFTIALSGAITLPDGPSAGLDNARFIFDGSGAVLFDLDGISGGTGDMTVADGWLPLNIKHLELHFGDGPLPQKIQPQNITFIVSAEMALMEGVTGGVGGLTIGLDADGRPRASIEQLYVAVSDLTLGTMSFTGGMAVGGLDDPATKLVFAGQLGGNMNGTGIEALVAFGMKEGVFLPLGASLEASLGSAGIPLGPSGFLLTGVSGGVSFTGSNADPDDLRNYVAIEPDHSVTSLPRPADPATVDVPPDQQNDLAPAQAAADGTALTYECPEGPCPPYTVGILYEPHPDATHYPHRVIFKMTALPESFVGPILTNPALFPVPLASMTADAIAAQLTTAVLAPIVDIAGLGELAQVAGLADAVAEHLAALERGLQTLFASAATAALAGNSNVYDALVAAAYRGVEAQHQTVKLTGTFSYTGVSAFLSVTGGFVLSPTAQSVGIVGSLNLLGIPVGQLRGFLTLNNAQGLPDPALCGDLSVALGPLELGTLRLQLKYGLDVTTLVGGIISLIHLLPTTLVDQALRVVAGDLYTAHGHDPVNTFSQMTTEQTLGFVALVLQAALADVRDFMVALFTVVYDSINPSLLLCGSAQPKLFGMALDGELVGVSAMADKHAFAASFRFSPTGVLSRVFYGALPAVDQMALSFRLALPSPLPLLEAGIIHDFGDPARMVGHIAQALDHVLAQGVASVTYRLAPFGLELADGQARLMMPVLPVHPVHPDSNWTRPESRPGNPPGRVEVTLAALRAGVLGNVFWLGTSDELANLFDPPATAAIGNMTLHADYFPHGGIVGAGAFKLPRLFLEPPPAALFGQLLNGTPLEKFEAASALVAALLDATEVGRLAFYIPAPNPPLELLIAGASAATVVTHMQDNPVDLRAVDLGTAYPLAEAFLQGSLGRDGAPLTLLGLPLVEASVELHPPDQGTSGILRLTSAVPPGSWLASLIGTATLDFELRQPPPQPIADHFAAIATALEGAADPQFLIAALGEELATALPKLSLVATISDLTLPPALRAVLDFGAGSAELHAYSLLYAYDPAFTGGDSLATVRNFGGIALLLRQGAIRLGPFSGEVQRAVVVVAPPQVPGQPPQLHADVHVGRAVAPGLVLEAAHMTVATHPPQARLRAEIDVLDLGVMRIEPLNRAASLTVEVDGASGRLRIDPARLYVPLLGRGAAVHIHGDTPDAPFTFAPDGAWHARLTVETLSVSNPFDRRQALLTLPGTASATLSGHGRQSAVLTLELATGSQRTINLFPGLPVGGSGAGRLTIRSEGSFVYESTHELTLAALTAEGTLRAGMTPPRGGRSGQAYARLDNASLRIAGLPPTTANLSLATTGISADVTFGRQFIGIPGLFDVRAGRWSLSYPFGRGEMTLTAAQGPTARLLGRPLASLRRLEISRDARRGSLSLNAAADSWLTLLPGLLEIRPETLQLRLGGARNRVDFAGSLRAFQRSRSSWHVNRSVSFALDDGPFELMLLRGDELTFLPSSGLIYRRTGRNLYSRLLLMRDDRGALALSLRHVGINFNGHRRLDAAVSTDGAATFVWNMTLEGAGMTYEPDESFQAAISLNTFSPSATLRIPAGRLRASFAGWPAGGYRFPARAVTVTTGVPSISDTYGCTARGWQSVPGFPFAQYRLTAPQITAGLDGNALSAQLSGGLEIRTVALRPDGERWAEVAATFTATIDAQGRVPLTFPAWPSLGDPFMPQRVACEAAAQTLHTLPPEPTDILPVDPPKKPNYDRPIWPDLAWAAYDSYVILKSSWDAFNAAVKALDDALEQCATLYPAPPVLAPLGSLTVALPDVISN